MSSLSTTSVSPPSTNSTDYAPLYLRLRHFETPPNSSSPPVPPSSLSTSFSSAVNPSPLMSVNIAPIPCCYAPTCLAASTTSADTAHQSNSQSGSSSDPTCSEWCDQGALSSQLPPSFIGSSSAWRRRRALIRITKFLVRMELSDIRKKQGRRASTTHISATKGRKQVFASGRSGGHWSLLKQKCRTVWFSFPDFKCWMLAFGMLKLFFTFPNYPRSNFNILILPSYFLVFQMGRAFSTPKTLFIIVLWQY